jgi:hypothetical protein
MTVQELSNMVNQLAKLLINMNPLENVSDYNVLRLVRAAVGMSETLFHMKHSEEFGTSVEDDNRLNNMFKQENEELIQLMERLDEKKRQEENDDEVHSVTLLHSVTGRAEMEVMRRMMMVIEKKDE